MVRLCCVFVLCAHLAAGQYFSGELHFQVKVIPKSDSISVDSLLNLQPGTSSVYLITDKYYKNTFFHEGRESYVYIYHDDSKRLYDTDPLRDYITYRDVRKNPGAILRTKIFRDSISRVAGQSCFMVENRYAEHTSKTYYSNLLKINPTSFKDHELNHWYQMISEVKGALPLKTVTFYDDYIQIEETVKIIPRDVSKKEFDLSQKPVYASNVTLDKQVMVKPPSQNVVDCYRDNLLRTPELFGSTRSYTSHVRFIISKDGKVERINPYKKDNYDLYKIAMDIISQCGIEFSPGEIEGEKVDAEVYFPIEFRL